MASIQHLIDIADAYKVAAGVEQDTTVSSRVFGDSKKLSALRAGADITISRFNAAMEWFGQNWPSDKPFPSGLRGVHKVAHGDSRAPVQGDDA